MDSVGVSKSFCRAKSLKFKAILSPPVGSSNRLKRNTKLVLSLVSLVYV